VSFRWLNEIKQFKLTKYWVSNSPSIAENPDPKRSYFFWLTKKSESCHENKKKKKKKNIYAVESVGSLSLDGIHYNLGCCFQPLMS
jgi:broad specificity polyphosphatase/5'/3'-nucleotidase SurE